MSQFNPDEIRNLWLHKNIKRDISNNKGHSGFGLNNPNYAINMYDWLKDALDLLGFTLPPVTSNSYSRIEHMGGYVEATSPNETLYLQEGDNISLDYSTVDNSITINSTAIGGNAFGIIAVDGQDDIVADSVSDTLTLVSEDLLITTDASTDTINFGLNFIPATRSWVSLHPPLGDIVIADQPSDLLELYVGSGITITGDNTVGSLTFNNTGALTAFKTISVSGQSDVIADAAADTLTLVAGTGMTITTNASTDTITFAASTGTDTNIYNTSGTLTGNRVLSFGGYNLDFSSLSAGQLDANFHTDVFAVSSGKVVDNDLWTISGTNIGAGAITLARSGTGWNSNLVMLSPSGNDPSIDINITTSGGLGTHVTDRLQTKNSIIDSVYDGTNTVNMSLVNNGSYTRASNSWSTGSVQAEIGVDAGLGSIFWTKTPLYTATHKIGMVLSSIDSGSTTATAKPTYPVTWTDLRWGTQDSDTISVGDYTANRLCTDADGASRRLVSVLVCLTHLSGSGESIELTIEDEAGTLIWDQSGISTNAAHVQEYTVGVNLAANKIYRGNFRARNSPGALTASGMSITLKTM